MVVIVFFIYVHLKCTQGYCFLMSKNRNLVIVFVGDNRPTKKKAKKSPNPSGNNATVSTVYLC